MENRRYTKKPNFGICVCGHDHEVETGTDFEGNESFRWEVLTECCYCDCENFRRIK